MSAKTQFIIVIIILIAIGCWLIWKLFFKKGGDNSACAGCSLAENCAKKELKKNNGRCE